MYLQINYIFSFFFQVLLNDDRHFVFGSKIFLKGALQSPRFQHEIVIWRHFIYLMTFHNCSQRLKPFGTKLFVESSNCNCIMPPWLKRTRNLMILGIMGPDCRVLVMVDKDEQPHFSTAAASATYCLISFIFLHNATCIM